MSGKILDRLVPPSVAALSAYSPPAGEYRVRLDANESPFDVPQEVRDRIAARLAGIPFNRYPDPLSKGLRQAFGRQFSCRPEEVMVGNGSDELIALVLWTLRRGRGGEAPSILVPVPTFSMYALSARAAGYRVAEVPLDGSLRLDLPRFLDAIRRTDPNVVFLSTPNNPTGTLFGRGEIEAVLQAARGLVVVDEAYADFSGEPSWAGEASARPNLAVLRTLSKVGGAALRCGFLVARPEILEQVNKLRLPFNINALTQAAAEEILEHLPLLREVAGRIAGDREFMARELSALGLEVFPSAANFILARAGGREADLHRFLQEGSIVVKFLPRLPVAGDALRITVGSGEENDALLERVREFMK